MFPERAEKDSERAKKRNTKCTKWNHQIKVRSNHKFVLWRDLKSIPRAALYIFVKKLQGSSGSGESLNKKKKLTAALKKISHNRWATPYAVIISWKKICSWHVDKDIGFIQKRACTLKHIGRKHNIHWHVHILAFFGTSLSHKIARCNFMGHAVHLIRNWNRNFCLQMCKQFFRMLS